MNNDGPIGQDKPLEPELLADAPVPQKNLMTILVLSITLAHEILGKKSPKDGKLAPGQGQLVIKAIEKAVKYNFPEIAPMILTLFGMEMLQLMPMLHNPEQMITEMLKGYSKILSNADSNPQPNME